MKLLIKILNFAVILTIVLNIMSIFNYEVLGLSYSSMRDQTSAFITAGKNSAEGQISIDSITGEFVPLGQLLTSIGAGVLIAVTIYMGIKYLTSGPEAQAKLKQQLIGVIVSAIVIFGAFGIWRTVGMIAKEFDG